MARGTHGGARQPTPKHEAHRGVPRGGVLPAATRGPVCAYGRPGGLPPLLQVPTLDDAAHASWRRRPARHTRGRLAYSSAPAGARLQRPQLNRRLATLRSWCSSAGTVGRGPGRWRSRTSKNAPYRDTWGQGKPPSAPCSSPAGTAGRQSAARPGALRLLYDLGLRRGEVVPWTSRHVHLTAGRVAVLGKGRRQPDILALPEPTKRRCTRG